MPTPGYVYVIVGADKQWGDSFLNGGTPPAMKKEWILDHQMFE